MFLMILQVLNHWAVCPGRARVKHPQTIIECHIKGFKVRLGGLGYHMSQAIFPDFRGFLEPKNAGKKKKSLKYREKKIPKVFSKN